MNSAEQFERIVGEHYEPLFRFAMSLTRSEPDACDLTQQTFYVWATKGHQLRDSSKVKTWLFTTLHRVFLDAQRKQNRYSHHELGEVVDELPTVSPLGSDHMDALQVLPALAKVDRVYQAPLALFYLEDYFYKEIAAILEVPMGTVKSRIARGIAQLREILLSDDLHPSPARTNRISSNANADESVARSESNSVPRRRHAPVKAGSRERPGDEWASRPALVREPLAVN
jgi:RNA polymerase sigma factor (sigma-70 family)